MKLKDFTIGIMAYGSLIDEPDEPISGHITHRFKFETPFRVEYARLSRSRGGAPTLIPVREEGAFVTGHILVLDDKVDLRDAKNWLYQRETRSTKEYHHSYSPGENTVQVLEYWDHPQVDMVLYTSIASNIKEELTPELLARQAVQSACTVNNGRDGISYLINNLKHNITTPLTKAYRSEILRITETSNLQAARESCYRSK